MRLATVAQGSRVEINVGATPQPRGKVLNHEQPEGWEDEALEILAVFC
jgi:hypothetical protein